MSRAIDGEAVKRRAWDIAEAWRDQGRNYEALLLENVVEQIVDTAPTLTPPNEPLALEQLRESPHGKIKDSTLESICNRANEIASRPPEGEEDTDA